jgi:hypothetical protein
MTDELIYLNGVDGATGKYLVTIDGRGKRGPKRYRRPPSTPFSAFPQPRSGSRWIRHHGGDEALSGLDECQTAVRAATNRREGG